MYEISPCYVFKIGIQLIVKSIITTFIITQLFIYKSENIDKYEIIIELMLVSSFIYLFTIFCELFYFLDLLTNFRFQFENEEEYNEWRDDLCSRKIQSFFYYLFLIINNVNTGIFIFTKYETTNIIIRMIIFIMIFNTIVIDLVLLYIVCHLLYTILKDRISDNSSIELHNISSHNNSYDNNNISSNNNITNNTSSVIGITNVERGDTTCSICLDNNDDDPWVELSCKHKFHIECVYPWLSLHNNCPNCRLQLSN